MKRIRLNRLKGYESISMEDGKLSVASVEKVRSLGDFSDFSVVTLADSSGRVVARGTVDARGLVGVVGLAGVGSSVVRDSATAEKVAKATGVTLATTPERVYMHGGVARSVFDEMFLATAKDGSRIIVGWNGAVYTVSATVTGKVAKKIKGLTYVAARDKQTWVLRLLGQGSQPVK